MAGARAMLALDASDLPTALGLITTAAAKEGISLSVGARCSVAQPSPYTINRAHTFTAN